MTAAVLIVAAVTYLLTSRSSHTPGARHSEPTSAATAEPAPSAEAPADAPSDSAAAEQDSTEPAERGRRIWMRELTDTLIRRADAHSLAAAALLMNANAADLSDPTERRDAFRSRVLDLLQRAAKAAPADLAVQSVALVFCRDSAFQLAGCDPLAYEEALASLDPTNAWVATGELRRANAAHDPARQARAIAAMARGQRIDAHRAEIEALFTSAIESVAVVPADHAGEDSLPSTRRLITSAINTSPVDALDAVTLACNHPTSGEASKECGAVAQLMRDSSDPILADQGFSLALHLTPPGSHDAFRLAQEKRREDWQTARFLRLPRTPEQNSRFLRDRIPGAGLRREVLLENGIPLEPPADWMPLPP